MTAAGASARSGEDCRRSATYVRCLDTGELAAPGTARVECE